MDGMDAHSLCRMRCAVCSRKEIQEKQIVVKNHRKSLKEKKRGCEKRIVPKKKKDQEFIMNSRSFFLL